MAWCFRSLFLLFSHILFCLSLFFRQKLCCGLFSLSFFCLCFFLFLLFFAYKFFSFFWVFFSFINRFITKKRAHRESDLFFVRRVRHIKNVSEYTRAHKYTRRDDQIWRSFVSKQKDPFFFRARARERETPFSFVLLFLFFLSFLL